MKLITFITAISTLLAAALGAEDAVKNTTQEYYLKAKLKPGQPSKKRFDGLWLEAYHTGAGLDDATLSKSNRYAAKGLLNGTNGHSGSITYQNQVFDLGAEFPSIMIPEPDVQFYTAWQPVRINAGFGSSNPKGQSGFWLNETGLQWTNALHEKPSYVGNAFGGWLVCDWWHGVPQLFFRIQGNYQKAPCSCADVDLCPEYI